MFIEQNKNRKEIAEALGVREKSVGAWAREGNWEELRTQRLINSQSVVTNLKALIAQLSQRRLEMESDIEADPSDKARLTDEISKHSKALSEIKGEGELTLAARLNTMEWVFEHMRKQHPDLHHKLIDFQGWLLEEAARLHA